LARHPAWDTLTEVAAQPGHFSWTSLQERIETMNLDAKVCYCFHVTRRKLLNFLRLEKPKVASQLSQCGGAGTGCGWCIRFLKQLFEQAQSGTTTELDDLTETEYAHRRSLYVRETGRTPPPGATPIEEVGEHGA
jgi:NAD(P)H-nitrite reductase large subunit